MKVYYTYDQIHQKLSELAPKIQQESPEIIVAIGGGGYIPARMLRTYLKIPIFAVSLELYNDSTNTINDQIIKRQWLDNPSILKGKRVLVVDEVDDTRTTLECCVREIQKCEPAKVIVAVIHSKQKEKTGRLNDSVKYLAGETIPDRWVVYPWEVRNIQEHTRLAMDQATQK